MLPGGRARDDGLLQLHGLAGIPVLQGQDRQVATRVDGLHVRMDDLADGPDGIDDLRTGGVGRELRNQLDLPGPIGVRRERERIGLGRFETDHGRLQHLREPLVEQRNRRGVGAAGGGQRQVHRGAGETERLQALDAGGLLRHRPGDIDQCLRRLAVRDRSDDPIGGGVDGGDRVAILDPDMSPFSIPT